MEIRNADREGAMNTSEAAAARPAVQAQGAQLPARRRAAAPLHGDDRHRRDVPDRGPGVQDVPGDARRSRSVILWTSLVDPASAEELQAQFANSDRVVLWGIIGFGDRAVLSISAVGILITHKVAGPLYKISSLFGRVRDNRMGPAPAGLRKGDELQEFYTAFREMHQAVRERVEEDVRVLGNARLGARDQRGGARAGGAARARRAAPAQASARKRAWRRRRPASRDRASRATLGRGPAAEPSRQRGALTAPTSAVCGGSARR